MSRGKDICKMNKQIRARIAEANNIHFTPQECTFEGDCTGTCPTCDAEAKLLETMLAAVESAGGEIILDNLCEEYVPKHNRFEEFIVEIPIEFSNSNKPILAGVPIVIDDCKGVSLLEGVPFPYKGLD